MIELQYLMSSGYIPEDHIAPITGKNKKSVVYLAGKVSGLDRRYVKLKFWLYEKYLNIRGHKVWNPVKNIQPDTPYDKAMFCCLLSLRLFCNGIYFMPDWSYSPGAKKEMAVAAKIGLNLINRGITIRAIYENIKKYYHG